jgi:hypothetical protein
MEHEMGGTCDTLWGEMHKRFSRETLDSGKETQVWRPPGKTGVDVKA